MAYCTVDVMKKLIPEKMIINLSNDTAGATTINTANVDEAIDQADREIDAYLQIAGYSVPIDPVPPIVENYSAKIAIWNLHLRKYFESKIWRDTYRDCIKTLEKIAEGKLSIGQREVGETSDGAGACVVDTRTQKFTETAWSEY